VQLWVAEREFVGDRAVLDRGEVAASEQQLLVCRQLHNALQRIGEVLDRHNDAHQRRKRKRKKTDKKTAKCALKSQVRTVRFCSMEFKDHCLMFKNPSTAGRGDQSAQSRFFAI
jgi:hypothetical protein